MHHVLPRHREVDRDRLPSAGAPHREPGSAEPIQLHVLAPDVGVRAPPERPYARPRTLGEPADHAVVGREHRDVAGSERFDGLGARVDDRLPRPEDLHVRHTDVRDHDHVRTDVSAQEPRVTDVASADLQHERLRVIGCLEHGQGHADLGVERARARVGAHPGREDRGGEVLGRRLPVRPRDPHDAARQLVAPSPREREERGDRIVDPHERQRGRRSIAPDDRRGGARVRGCSHEVLPVVDVASDREEQSAVGNAPGVGGHGPDHDVGSVHRSVDEPRDPRDRLLVHALVSKACSSSAATVRSSKGTIRSASSCPVS